MRRIKRAEIDFLSLCPRGANKQPVLYKQGLDGDLSAEIQTLTKALEGFDEKGELLALAYVPNLVDVQGDYATADAVTGMAHSFMRKGAKLDIRHNETPVPLEKAFVAENFIVQKDDARFKGWTDYDGKAIDATGSWAVLLKIQDPELRKLYRENKWNGVSFGSRDFELESVTKSQGDTAMDPELLKKILAENAAAILKAVDEKLAKIAPPPAPPADGKIIFKGDITKIEDVRRHANEVKRAQLLKSIDTGDLDALALLEKQLEAEAAERLSKETPDQKAERLSKENAVLKVALEKAQRTSTVPALDTTPAPGNTPTPEGLTKEDVAAQSHGKRIAKLANESRGFSKPAMK